jgi:HAD superfamily phosphoserine phosphatase-like hydrolase
MNEVAADVPQGRGVGDLEGGDLRASGRAAAFFDLDRTLMAGSSGIYFARAAFESGMISRRRLARDAAENVRFRLRGSTDERADAVRTRVGEMIAGVPVYIVTAALQEMADLLARVLVLDGGIGSRLEARDGLYTGRAGGPFNYRDGKVTSIEQLAEQEGFDLSACYAYSDSESDLPMLRAVGHPVVVNPDAELTTIAKQEGWEIVRLDRLSARLKIAAALAAGTAAAGLGMAARQGVATRVAMRQ